MYNNKFINIFDIPRALTVNHNYFKRFKLVLLTSVDITTDKDSLKYHDRDHIYVFSFVNFNQCYKIQIESILNKSCFTFSYFESSP